ncbi:MAG TPA: rhomboid family intramembrane serine protease [Chthoniobacteraceae bacterium]|nr:rhomboid family intramembrane serine protease [Chthoniobacteraceae bacterium]
MPKRQMQPSTHSWSVGYPQAWMILIAVNVGVFTAQQIVNLNDAGWINRIFALSDAGVRQGYLWQFVTCTFLHGGWLHLAANMMLLYFAGREVEALIGPRHFLAIYFGGGLLGSIAQWAIPPHLPGGLMGASAGVLATLIAFATILPELDLTCYLFFVVPVHMKAKYLARIVVGLTLLALAVPYAIGHFALLASLKNVAALFQNNHYITAHYAHLAGCLLGWTYVKQLGYGNPLWIQRYFFDKRLREQRRKHMNPEQFIHEEIDPILEKISREGIRSLTRAEKRILEMGREKITKRRP